MTWSIMQQASANSQAAVCVVAYSDLCFDWNPLQVSQIQAQGGRRSRMPRILRKFGSRKKDKYADGSHRWLLLPCCSSSPVV